MCAAPGNPNSSYCTVRLWETRSPGKAHSLRGMLREGSKGEQLGTALGYGSAARNQHMKTQPHITALDKAEQGFVNLADSHGSSELLTKYILPINWGGKSWSRSGFEDGFMHICLTFLLVPPSLLAYPNPMDLEMDLNMDRGLELLKQRARKWFIWVFSFN